MYINFTHRFPYSNILDKDIAIQNTSTEAFHSEITGDTEMDSICQVCWTTVPNGELFICYASTDGGCECLTNI